MDKLGFLPSNGMQEKSLSRLYIVVFESLLKAQAWLRSAWAASRTVVQTPICSRA